MRMRSMAVAAVLAAAVFAGACGSDDNPAVGDGTATPSSTSKAQAAATCGTIRKDLDQLTEMMGVPDSLDQARQMVSGELDQLRRTLNDIQAAGDNDSGQLEPVRSSLEGAVQNAQDALDAVGDANFGTARDKAQAAVGALGRAKSQLEEACGS